MEYQQEMFLSHSFGIPHCSMSPQTWGMFFPMQSWNQGWVFTYNELKLAKKNNIRRWLRPTPQFRMQISSASFWNKFLIIIPTLQFVIHLSVIPIYAGRSNWTVINWLAELFTVCRPSEAVANEGAFVDDYLPCKVIVPLLGLPLRWSFIRPIYDYNT